MSAPPVDVLRDAARRAAASTSLRATASEIGITHRSLARFLAGETETRESTTRKLRDWYVRRAASTGDVTAETAEAALSVLVASLPQTAQAEAEAELVDVLGKHHDRSKRERPAWLRKMTR